MTEAEWLAFDAGYRSWPHLFTSAAEWIGPFEPCRDLLHAVEDSGTRRQLLLFGCACCRRIAHLLEEAGLAAVEAVERLADGVETEEEVLRRLAEVELVPHLGWPDHEQRIAARAVAGLLTGLAFHHAAFAAGPGRAERLAERRAQYRLYLDIYARPHPPPVVNPAWLAWDRRLVANLAELIHAEHRFADMDILADALEDAGCADQALLGHFRNGGPHIRGYWALELILDHPS